MGPGLFPTLVIQWNGTNRLTSFLSSIQIQAVIFFDDIATVGSAQVRVFNPAPGRGTSNAVTFNILIPPEFVFVANFNDDTVSIFAVDVNTGQLEYNGNIGTGSGPISVTVNPSGAVCLHGKFRFRRRFRLHD